MTVRSTFSDFIHACNVVAVSASGSPEEKPNNNTTAIRQLVNTCTSFDSRSEAMQLSNALQRQKRLASL
jgi:hypothetical protein